MDDDLKHVADTNSSYSGSNAEFVQSSDNKDKRSYDFKVDGREVVTADGRDEWDL